MSEPVPVSVGAGISAERRRQSDGGTVSGGERLGSPLVGMVYASWQFLQGKFTPIGEPFFRARDVWERLVWGEGRLRSRLLTDDRSEASVQPAFREKVSRIHYSTKHWGR